MRVLNYDEFSLLGPLPLEIDPRPLLSECSEKQESIFASLNILGKVTLANARLIGVLIQLGHISNSLASYDRSLVRRMRYERLKQQSKEAEEYLAYLADTESQ
jgi:hypothetical protein